MNWLNESSTVLNLLTKSVLIVLVALILTSCAWLGTKNPHTEGLIIPPKIIETTSPVEEEPDTTLIITPSTWFATEDIRG